jgi:hypothetical protein
MFRYVIPEYNDPFQALTNTLLVNSLYLYWLLYVSNRLSVAMWSTKNTRRIFQRLWYKPVFWSPLFFNDRFTSLHLTVLCGAWNSFSPCTMHSGTLPDRDKRLSCFDCPVNKRNYFTSFFRSLNIKFQELLSPYLPLWAIRSHGSCANKPGTFRNLS